MARPINRKETNRKAIVLVRQINFSSFTSTRPLSSPATTPTPTEFFFVFIKSEF
ncbi:hypothetical protein Sjap_004586 [Stephania japonica]|uniref:Uncharacterized protein n=1 Tax=Stephania japonica TaxID=461633 RepID=A0AAP0PH51_9MAGN